MSVECHPKIITDGLVFYYDQSNTQKSWKGEPTVNLSSDMGLNNIGITVTYIGIEDGWKKYSLSGTWASGGYPYSLYVSEVSFTGGVTYSTGCYIKTNVLSKFDYKFVGMNYVNVAMNKEGTSFSIPQSDGSFYVGRYNFEYTTSTSQPGYLVSKPLADGTTFNPATDFVYIKNGQVEQKDHNTPFVVGTRSNTQAILDLTNNNTITASSLTYASDGSFSFNGSSDYIDSGSIAQTGTSTQSLTWACWVKSTATSGDIINMVYPTSGWNMCPIYASGQQFYAKIWSNSSLAAGSTFNLNQYYYLVLVRDNSLNTNLFYINGQLSTSQTGAYSASGFANNHYFGRAGSQATNTYLTGNIPIGQIYNRALSANEISQNFNAIRSRYGI